jgi:carbamoyltransferase
LHQANPLSTYILGISAYYHDSAACLLRDGHIVAAAQEERFTRKKQDSGFPAEAIAYCLKTAGLTAQELDYVGFYDKPLIKFERLLETYVSFAPKGVRSFWAAMPQWLKTKVWVRDEIQRELDYDGPILFCEHHESHAASAFYPSPFEDAAILTIDGVGEWATTTYGMGEGNQLKLLAEIGFPHSLGLLYSAFTYYTGFRVNSAEYKVMGLAPYGEPTYVDLILDKLIDLKPDGSFRLNQDYFNYAAGLTMTNKRFDRLFGSPPRQGETHLTQKEMDLARSVQEVTEMAMLRMAEHVYAQTKKKYLCMAGGVALNCVANGRILRESSFEDLWIQPASGDSGGALGIALYIWHQYLQKPRSPQGDSMQASLLGPCWEPHQIEHFLDREDLTATRVSDDQLADHTARLIEDGQVVGWFQGRMEFGPRALGARSILGDPRRQDMQSKLNVKIKFRESFRPFAPSVLREKVQDYFELDHDSPYMLLVSHINQEHRTPVTETETAPQGLDKLKVAHSSIPAVTHVDHSARVQTVSRDDHKQYYDLIKAFENRTGCAVIINTSFNVRGEPIVCSPQDAYRCFMRTDMDYLVLGNYILNKEDQDRPQEAYEQWRKELPLD